MTKDELAEALGCRLAERCTRGELDGALPGGRDVFLENLKHTSSDNLIAGFLKCSVCGRMTMPVGKAVWFAAYARTVEDWIKFLIGWQRHTGQCCHDIDKPE